MAEEEGFGLPGCTETRKLFIPRKARTDKTAESAYPRHIPGTQELPRTSTASVVSDSLTRQLQALGLERKLKPVAGLAEYKCQKNRQRHQVGRRCCTSVPCLPPRLWRQSLCSLLSKFGRTLLCLGQALLCLGFFLPVNGRVCSLTTGSALSPGPRGPLLGCRARFSAVIAPIHYEKAGVAPYCSERLCETAR